MPKRKIRYYDDELYPILILDPEGYLEDEVPSEVVEEYEKAYAAFEKAHDALRDAIDASGGIDLDDNF